MILQQTITKDQKEVRCINLIQNKKDKKYGEICHKLLMKLNSNGKAAGEIVCQFCKAKYEIKNMILILKDSGGKK